VPRNLYQDIRPISHTSSHVTRFAANSPLFICVISYTDTCTITGITAAGANKRFVKFTPAADSEFLCYGFCKCINKLPITPDGKPTPAIVTRAVLGLADMPFQIIDAGSKVKPSIPYISFGMEPGESIESGAAVASVDVKKGFEYGRIIGRQAAKLSDLVVVGESIPGGTTTTLGVLHALGVDSKFKVSSSMRANPHKLKNKIVNRGLQKARLSFGELKNDPFEAIARLGDPLMPSIAGITEGVLTSGGKTLLAGGTQMASILAILRSIGVRLKDVCVGTTVYVAFDRSSDLDGLINSISTEVPVFAADLHMEESSIVGLASFARGFVKDGVGAGGCSIAAMLKSKGRINGHRILKAVEKEYIHVLPRDTR
jgi:uncharacterized protein (TIGR00303 family)